ncbi:type II toxin-antitoxin system HicA family toxin [Chloroflexota bacterium]
MSPKLKRLSSSEVIAVLHAFGFETYSQRGSHVKLRSVTATGEKQTLTIPVHAELDAGTLRAIIRQASRYIPDSELRPHFYSA